MTTLKKIFGVAVTTLSVLVVASVASAAPVYQLQPASRASDPVPTITYHEELVVNNTGRFK